MRAIGASPGCGVVWALPDGVCGLAESARVLRWYADQGAGQCGPCLNGLPAIADTLRRRWWPGRGPHRPPRLSGGGCRW